MAINYMANSPEGHKSPHLKVCITEYKVAIR